MQRDGRGRAARPHTMIVNAMGLASPTARWDSVQLKRLLADDQ